MLLFISNAPSGVLAVSLVSIHLMLLFISTRLEVKTTGQSFNTSHVTLYPVVSGFRYEPVFRFNTSHVTLYHILDDDTNYPNVFQYISCYSLSLVFPIFSLLTFFIISQNTRVCNIFPKQHRLFESFHRSTPKPYIFTTFHIFL